MSFESKPESEHYRLVEKASIGVFVLVVTLILLSTERYLAAVEEGGSL